MTDASPDQCVATDDGLAELAATMPTTEQGDLDAISEDHTDVGERTAAPNPLDVTVDGVDPCAGDAGQAQG